MFCSSCGTECSEDANFCWSCGSALVRGCQQCGRALRPDARFCEGCGTETGASPQPVAQPSTPAAPAPSRPAAPAPADDGPVRKTVTVLFVDLVGSTSFQESVDPEAARGAMTRYYDMVQRVVDQHEGTVAKFQGDGALAVFGVPEVAEDDAARAVATGVALQQAFAEIRDYVADRYRVEVGLRVGINTGEVVIAAEDADLVGDVLNTAARLEAACTPGRVMVGEDTWRLTRSTITYEVLGEISVKGKAEPIATFQVVDDVAADVTEDDVATPFVGRDAELAALAEAYRAAGQTTSARLVTVIGAPGVGKTRLAAELVSSLPEARAFDLRCERAGTSTFAPIADLLRSVAGVSADQSGPQVEASVADWLGAAPDAERLRPLLSSFVGGAETFSTEELFFGARRLVELVAQERPAVIVVDDIQWAEPLLLDLLEHLIEWVTDAHVLVIGLARPELREIRPSLAQPGRRVEAAVSLEGLDPDATAELAAKLVGADRLPADLLARLPESTQGNPLFVRELMQMLVDDGVIARGPAGWALTIDADAVDVPPTIQSLLSTRVERMPVDERRLVELAAVVGPDFARGAVAAITDGWSPGQVDDVFRRLERKELIEPTGSYWGNEPIYRFHHVLIRDAAYRRLLKGSRADLHLLVAEWTEQTASALTGEHEVSIAHHYEQAYTYRRELGLDDDETTAAGTKAAALLTVAADRALARDDLPAAGSLALRAIDCLADDAAEVPALLLTANEALLSSGDVARATPALEQLETYADEERLRQWATCFRGQLTVLADPAGLDVAADRLDEAAATLDRLDDAAGVAKARQIRALALASLGRVGECEAELDRALTAARKADDRRRVTAVLGAAPVAALWGPSPVPRAGGRCLDVIRLLRITTGSPAVEATSIRCQAVLEALRGRFETARTMLGTARETAEEMGLRRDLMETEFYAGLVELLADDAVAAEPHLRRAYDGLDRLGIGADAGQAAAHLARALLIQGRIDEAEELAGTSDALAGQNTQTAIAARSVRAEVLSARGRHDEAVPLAQEAVAIASGTDILVDHAQALAALARVQAAAGQTADADTSAANARTLFDQKGATVEVGSGAEVPRSATSEVEPVRGSVNVEASGLASLATEMLDEMLAEITAGRRLALERFAADFSVADFRSDSVFAEGDREAYVEQAASLAAVGNVELEIVEVLALRGDHLALSRGVIRYGPDYVSKLAIVHAVTGDGRIQRFAIYDSDDIVPAYRELERLFLDSLDPADREPWATIAAWVGFHNEGDVEAMEAWMRRDLQVVDHGTLGWGTQDRDSAVARFAETAGALEYAFPTRILRYGNGASLSSHRYQYHDGAAVEGYALTHNTTDTAHRAEYFDLDQLDLALRRFDEVTSSGAEPDGVATPDSGALELATSTIGRNYERIRQAVNSGDVERLRETWAPDLSLVSRRKGVSQSSGDAGFDEVVRISDEYARDGFTIETDEPVAIRGDRFGIAVMRMVSPDGWVDDRFTVDTFDDLGRLTLSTAYDADDFQSAVADLDERYLASLEGDERAVMTEVIELFDAVNRQDIERLRAGFPDGGSVVDRSHLSFPELDGAAFIERLLEPAAQGAFMYLRSVPRLDGNRYLIDVVRRFPNGDETGRLQLQPDWRPGEPVRFSVYEPDQIDEAMAAFDALSVPTEVDRADEVALVNRATVEMNKLAAMFRAGDIASGGQLLTDDFVRYDRRSGVAAAPLRGPEAMVTSFEALHALGLLAGFDPRPIAIRGDDLALFDTTMAADDSVELTVLQLTALRPGDGAYLLELFDADDVAGAVARLDELYMETLEPAEEAVFDVISRHFAALASGDLERMVELLADDVSIVDHQPLGWGRLDRSAYMDRMASMADRGDSICVEVHEIGAKGAAFSVSVVRDGESSKVVHWACRTEDGRHQVIESFPEGRLDAALERYGELATTTAPSGLVNHCDAVVRELLRRADDHDWAGVEQLIAADGLRWYGELGFGVLAREVLAIRGDDMLLAAMTWTTPDGDHVESLAVEEIDDAGKIVAAAQFRPGDLASAAAELDRRDAARLPASIAAWGRDATWFTATVVSADLDALEPWLAEDFTSVDHRRLGLGSRSRSDFLASVGARPTTLGHGVGFVPEIYAADPDCGLFSYEARTTATDSGSPIVERAVAAVRRRDGLWVDVDLYDFDQLDDARRRYDELRELASVGSEHRTNRERLAQQCMNPSVERGVFAHDLVMDDRRTIVGLDGAATGKDVLFDVNNGRPTTRFELIEERHDRVLLHSQTVTDADAGWESHFLAVNRFDERGMCDLLVMFDPHDHEAALAEFERLAAALDGSSRTSSPSTEPQTPLVRTMYELVAAGEASDRPAVEDFLAPELRRVDHRGIGAPPQGRDEWISTFIDLMNVGEGSFDVVATRGDHLALVDGYRITSDDFEIRFLFLTGADVDGRIVHMENFDVDDLAPALARLDDLFVASLDPADRQPFVRVAQGIHARNAAASGRSAMVPPGASFTGDGAIEFPELTEDSDAARLLGAAELGGTTVMQPVHVAREGAVLASLRTTLDAAEVVWHFVFRADGDALAVTYFDEDSLEEARQALDAPVDEPAAVVGRPTNRATDVSDRMSELVRNGHVDDLIDWWTPDAIARDYSRLGQGTGGREEFVTAMRSWREVWDIGQPDTGGPIAINGDHAALVEYRFGTVGSWSVDRLAVLVVDDDDKITELTFYDHEDREVALQALADLDVADTPVAADAPSAEPTPSLPRRTGPTNRADRLARQHGVRFGDSHWSVVETLGVRVDDFALHRIVDDAGASALGLSCWTATGEQVTAQRFGDDAAQKAFFELDEWAGDTVSPRLWRQSAIRAWAKATQEHDWATARELLHPDYTATSHQLLGPDELRGEHLVRWFESMETRAVTFVVATPEVHVMSEAGFVVWEEFEQIDTDGFAISNGGVSVVVVRDGKLAQSARFDDEQLLEAIEMLEEIAAAAGLSDTIVYASEPARALRPQR